MPTDQIADLSRPLMEEPLSNLELEYEPPGGKKHKKLLIAAAILGVAVLAGLLVWQQAVGAAKPVFQLATLQQGRIEANVTTTGSLNPVVEVQVGSQVSGNIKALYADFNTHVKQGQLVALIDPAPFQAAVNQAQGSLSAAQAAVVTAQANLAKAQADYAAAQANVADQKANVLKAGSAVDLAKVSNQREGTLLQEGIVAQQDADSAKAVYQEALADQQAAQAGEDAAKANAQSALKQEAAAQTQVKQAQAVVQQDEAALAQAQLNLSHTRIVAPVDGTVIARNMDVGQTVAASFQAPTIFQVAQDLTKMQVDTNVAEADVGHLKVGQPATFTVDAYPTTEFHGKIVQIREAPINVQNVITYDAVVGVSNPDLKLFPGMTANVRILTQSADNVLKAPNAALRFRPPKSIVEQPVPTTAGLGSAVVYVEDHGKARGVVVKTGITDGTFTEIDGGGMKAGDSVIVGVTMPASSSAPPLTPQRGFHRL
ncbi:MAG TPA: efflux RND transporter periplasmic adaptor subunit [Bryobacteraceae bacterium]|nr:efflux RND transporter periplasmic adaptor subunit [Bryobacteraceae bacterium]